jgi:pSer/pThr/pTyr-binding forkhead associated (FHA) protein
MDHDDGPQHVEHEPTIIYQPSGEPAAGASGSSVAGAFGWALTVETGPQAGLTYVLGDGETLVGRGGDCDIFLGDVTVSRHHATMSVDSDGLSMEDLGSTNGTYVNGERAETARLNAGDELIIGKFHLIVARGDV